MVGTLIYRKYQRRIHHVLTILLLFRYSLSCYVPCLTIHSRTPYDFHVPTTIIPCGPAIILVIA
ncbi:hypothetical protein Hanom_Chr10g00886491 [Helianthus anomalus]